MLKDLQCDKGTIIKQNRLSNKSQKKAKVAGQGEDETKKIISENDSKVSIIHF